MKHDPNIVALDTEDRLTDLERRLDAIERQLAAPDPLTDLTTPRPAPPRPKRIRLSRGPKN